ncbi:Importin-9 [Gryllus bimaculatus]|nr:Importin-9 [Gryllus bimaculatus]
MRWIDSRMFIVNARAKGPSLTVTWIRKYSVGIRRRAVEIFTTVAHLISATSDYNKGVTKTLLNPVLPSFCMKFIQGLQIPDGVLCDSGLKTEIIKALTALVKNFPKQMNKFLPQVLQGVWHTLTHSADVYLKTVISDTENTDCSVDSDGEVLGIPNLVLSIFEFIHAVVDCPKFSQALENGLSDLFYYLILFMEITEEQVHVWTTNPNQFVEDEDENTFAYSVRISAQDLLLTLCQEFEDQSYAALCQACTRHLAEAKEAQNMCNPNWWKVHEACMYMLGSVKDLVKEKLQAGNTQYDLVGFLESVVMPDMNSSGSPLLLGRCLWVGSQYAHFMSTPVIEQFLQATVAGLQPNQSANIRISAVRPCHCGVISGSLQGAFTESRVPGATPTAIGAYANKKENLAMILPCACAFPILDSMMPILSKFLSSSLYTLSGGECLRTYISIAPEQVCSYHDSEGHTGLWYILQVAALLLNPSSSEYSATFVGRLLITLITKAGDVLGDNLDLLLKAVLSKMQRAQTLSVIQHGLAHNDERLSSISVKGDQLYVTEGEAGTKTRSQSQNQMDHWTTIPLLVKIYKLLVNELSNAMEASAAKTSEDLENTKKRIRHDDARGIEFHTMANKGNFCHFCRENVATYANAIIKILNNLEKGDVLARSIDKSNELEFVLEPAANAVVTMKMTQAVIWRTERVSHHTLVGQESGDDGVDDDDDAEDDPDILQDPVYHLNMQQYLTDFLQSVSQQPCFPVFSQHLNNQERQVLAAIGIAL